MPKAKTSTKKRAPGGSKKTSNKSNSSKGLSKRFSLQSRKVQFFVFIFVVALLGGGWFTYKSFANARLYSAVNNTFVCLQSCEKKNDFSKDASGAKNQITILSIKQNGVAVTSHPVYLVAGTKYNVCVNARREVDGLAAVADVNLSSVAKTPSTFQQFRTTSISTGRIAFTNRNFTSYENRCVIMSRPATHTGNYYFSVSNSRNNPLYVATVDIRPMGQGK